MLPGIEKQARHDGNVFSRPNDHLAALNDHLSVLSAIRLVITGECLAFPALWSYGCFSRLLSTHHVSSGSSWLS